MADNEDDLTFQVIVPAGGECREFELIASPKDTGEKLKKKIEKASGIPCDDMELFAMNPEGDSKQKWIFDDASLRQQEIQDSAVITVAVHGTRGATSIPEEDESGEIPQDAVQNSIYTKGDSSYYHAHARKADLPEEHRIALGGAPQKLGDCAVLSEPISTWKQRVQEHDEEDVCLRPERPILNYAWGDEAEVVKIYISQDSEPDAVAAARAGKSGEAEVRWKPRSLKLRIHGEKLDFVLDLDPIYYEIVPEESKFRVSENKRVTLTLKKKESFTWLKLLKPES